MYIYMYYHVTGHVVLPEDSEKIQAEAVKKKMAALHLHCQLLVSQVGKIKSASAAPAPNPQVRWWGSRSRSSEQLKWAHTGMHV